MPRARHSPHLAVGAHLIRQLQHYGVRHVFGIPGDYILRFYQMLEQSPVQVVGVTREDAAGYAADAYARVNGIGAICVTYCVGSLNAANAVAGAYAEKSPVVVIAGSPGVKERVHDPMLHHKVRTFSTQREIFEKITCATVVLDDPDLAFRQIDETLAACWKFKRPVYIELPRDMVEVIPDNPVLPHLEVETSDREALKEALAETVRSLNAARKPVILADVEIHRYGLGRELEKLVDDTGIPIAASILGKSVISEKHPRYLGVYEGAMGRPDVQRAVEQADCLLMLGTFLTDLNMGIYTANLNRDRCIEATSEKIQIRHHLFTGVLFGDFMRGLLKADIRRCRTRIPKLPHHARAGSTRPLPKKDCPLTVTALFDRLNDHLNEKMVVISDVGVCLFAAMDLVIHRGTEFLAPAYYTSMGFSIPAALGAQMADQKLRPVVVVGDGAFQMTGTELSTIARMGLNPIVLILNNHGYTTERFILEGPFNDIAEWNYEAMPTLLGSGWACAVHTEMEFETAWIRALSNRKGFSLLNIHLDKMDHSPALERLGKRLAAKLRKTKK